MKQETIIAAVVGLLVGALLTGFGAAMAVNNNNTGMMRMMGMHREDQESTTDPYDHGSMSMHDMSNELSGLTGDDFDQAYLEMMIAHHKGAIDMAELAATNAKHEEIKTLSTQIIDTQAKEISQMKQWQQDWGYDANDMPMMNHE